MKKLPIYFFSENTPYNLKQKLLLRNWIYQAVLNEGFTLNTLNFIFCNDDYLLTVNRKYLKHNTYTDIITFDNSNKKEEILGDIFISTDRVTENAVKFGVSKVEEIHRVMIHGTLHLMGYKDKSKAEKALMTKKENEYLSLINS